VKRCQRTVAALWAVTLAANGCRSPQQKATVVPKFEDYPVADIFKGKPAPLQPLTSEEKAASPVILKAIETGSWPDKTKSRVPNFAGHYYVVEGPNAPDYAQVIIVDLVTGRIFQPPFAGKGGPSASYFSIPADPFNFSGMEFRLNSRLVVLPRTSPVRAAGYSTYRFLWEDDKWSPVQ
jgi:hypothetical protein